MYKRQLPEGEITTSEKDGYTHFTSAIDFEDINFLPHVSIDNFSENPPDRFYAKIEKEESFFSIKYYFEDFVEMCIRDRLRNLSLKQLRSNVSSFKIKII